MSLGFLFTPGRVKSLDLRRMAGSPVPSENFVYADIKAGVVGPDQPEPVAHDE